MKLLIQIKFLVFLFNLKKWLTEQNNFCYKRCWIILDNCTSHKAKIVTSFLNDTDWIIYYLPPYSPQYAPVEMLFGILKNIFIKKSNNLKINCNKNEIFFILLSTLKDIKKVSWIKMFKKMLQTLIENIQQNFLYS